MTLNLGILFLFAGVLSLIVGVVVAISGKNAGNKKMRKIGVSILLAGALWLLLSFTLCTAAFNG